MKNTNETFSKAKLVEAVTIKWPDCPLERIHIELAEALSEHLGRPISGTQAKGWLSGIRPGSDMLKAIAHVVKRKMEWFYE